MYSRQVDVIDFNVFKHLIQHHETGAQLLHDFRTQSLHGRQHEINKKRKFASIPQRSVKVAVVVLLKKFQEETIGGCHQFRVADDLN